MKATSCFACFLETPKPYKAKTQSSLSLTCSFGIFPIYFTSSVIGTCPDVYIKLPIFFIILFN